MKPKVLIMGEFSGRVREEFKHWGCDATSCDYLPTEIPGKHYQGDVRNILDNDWDAMIAFPDCTYLASSGLHWNKRRPERKAKTEEALEFVRFLLSRPIPCIALENPVGCISTRIRKPDQIIQPWQFGEDASKATCLWLKRLPLLVPTKIIRKKRYANQTSSGQNNLGPSDDRPKERSLTYPGIAKAMADQWAPIIKAHK